MSVELISWANAQRVGDMTAKAVLKELGNCASLADCRAFPSLQQLCDAIEASPNTIRRALRLLEDAGFIRVEANHDPSNGRQRANSYFLLTQAPSRAAVRVRPYDDASLPLEKGRGSDTAPSKLQDCRDEASAMEGGEGSNCCTPLRNRQKNPSEESPPTAPRGARRSHRWIRDRKTETRSKPRGSANASTG